MREEQFDKIIKSKLSGFVSQATPDWGVFLEKKSVADAEYKASESLTDFDKNIKDTMAAHISETTPQWAAFLAHKVASNLEEDYSFDSHIKEEVDSYEAPQEPNWAAFKEYEAAYDSLQEADDFDAKVRGELDGYEVTSQPQWAALVAKQFDQKISATVEAYETDTQPQWEKLLKRKREEDAIIADGNFDRTILGQLGKQKVKYNSKHWSILRDRLQQIAYVRKQIFSYKTLEIIFTSLLLFTLGNHFYLVNDGAINDKIINDRTTTPIVLNEESLATGHLAGKTGTPETVSQVQIAEATKPVTDSKAVYEGSSPATIDRTERNSNSVKAEVTSRLSSSSAPSSVPPAIIAVNAIGADSGDILDKGFVITKDSEEQLMSDLASREQSIGLRQEDNSTVVTRSLMASAELLSETRSTSAISYNRALPEIAEATYVNLRAKKKYIDKGNWFHLVNSMDNNLITTPVNQELGLLEKTNEKSGYSVELLYSKAYKNLEMELGVAYSFVNYSPYDSGAITYDVDRSVRELDFTSMDLDFISVPMNLKYHFVSNGRWSVFAGAGLSNELILKTSYSIKDEVIFRGGSPTSGPPEAEDLPGFYDREFTSGIFGAAPELPMFIDYKTKSNNYILRGTLSFGAERNISDNFAAYIRATYYHTLYNDQIGPYNDRLNKVNYGMGFKIRL